MDGKRSTLAHEWSTQDRNARAYPSDKTIETDKTNKAGAKYCALRWNWQKRRWRNAPGVIEITGARYQGDGVLLEADKA